MKKSQTINVGKLEHTLILIKPDALKNSLTGFVLSQLSEVHSGLRFSAAKIVNVSLILAEEHYAEHREKAFYGALTDYIQGRVHYGEEPHRRRVIAFVYQGMGTSEAAAQASARSHMESSLSGQSASLKPLRVIRLAAPPAASINATSSGQ